MEGERDGGREGAEKRVMGWTGKENEGGAANGWMDAPFSFIFCRLVGQAEQSTGEWASVVVNHRILMIAFATERIPRDLFVMGLGGRKRALDKVLDRAQLGYPPQAG